MAHFCKIENGIVTQVIVIANDKAPGEFPSSEEPGSAFCNSLIEGDWKQTSYNNNFRVRYAGIGYEYSSEHDAFIAPKPFDSWVLNLEKLEYEAPIEYPDDEFEYEWSEDNIEWVKIEIEQ